MSRVHPSDVIQLQKNTDNIRNFCILAHVDHGIYDMILSIQFSYQFSILCGRQNYIV